MAQLRGANKKQNGEAECEAGLARQQATSFVHSGCARHTGKERWAYEYKQHSVQRSISKLNTRSAGDAGNCARQTDPASPVIRPADAQAG
jgi:hypothetical protein